MNTKAIGFAAAIVSAILLGSVGIFVRNISTNVYIITFARVSIGLFFLVIFLLYKKQLHQVIQSKFSFSILISGILLSVTIFCYTNAVNNTSLANAAFLLYLAPIIAVGLTATFLRERFTVINGVLLCLAFIGLLFMIEFRVSLRLDESNGFLWGISASICYALFILFNRKISTNVSTLTRAFHQFLFAAIAMIPFMDNSLLSLSKVDIYWLIAVGFFQGFLATTLLIIAIKYLKAVEYGTISYVEPLVAGLVGYILYAEGLTSLQIIGCTIVLCCGIVQVIATGTNKMSTINRI